MKHPRRSLTVAAFVLSAILVLGGILSAAIDWPITFAPAGLTNPAPSRFPLPAARYRAVLRPDLAYGPLPGESLDLCTPATAGTRPGVLLIHGGGWVRGDKRAYDSLCRYLAGQGLVAASAGYRLARADRPSTRWPAQLVDVQLAIRWLRAHSAELDLDPARLCAWGSSAGGHLAAFLGALKTIHPGDEAGMLTVWSPAATCVIDEFGPSDLATIPTLRRERTALLGAAGVQQIAALRDASPVFSIAANSAPMLIVQGTLDTTVPPGQSLELLRALRRRGVPVGYIGYAGGHGFSGLAPVQRLSLEARELAYLSEYDQRPSAQPSRRSTIAARIAK